MASRHRKRAWLAALLVVGLAGASVITLRLFAPAGWPFSEGTAPVAAGSLFSFPAEASLPPLDSYDAAMVIRTSLPEGTQVLVSSTDSLGSGSGGPTYPVTEGTIRATINNQHCENGLAEAPESFTVIAGVAPAVDPAFFALVTGYEPECPRGPCKHLEQPGPVLSVLGRRFERLTGSQVMPWHGANVAVGHSPTYSFPAGGCRHLHPQLAIPTCPPQQPLFLVQARDLKYVAGKLAGVANEWKPCLAWASASAGFRATHPWPAFRDEFGRWLDRMGRLPDFVTSEQSAESSGTFPYRGTPLPERFSAEYRKGALVVARGVFEHVPAPAEGPQRYELDELDLLG
jgi:hypothetical protein